MATKAEIKIAPSSMTRASLVDVLADKSCIRTMGKTGNEIIQALLINSSEYGALIGEGNDNSFYTLMQEVWDGRDYSESRRSNKDGTTVIRNPYLNMLTCTQPGHFNQHFNKQAWERGYASRCDYYYTEMVNDDFQYYLDYIPSETDKENSARSEFVRSIAHDLQHIWAQLNNENGPRDARQVFIDRESVQRLEHWYRVEREETEFRHPWLVDYNKRRFFRLRRDICLFATARAGMENYTANLIDTENAIKMHARQDTELKLMLQRITSSETGDILQLTHAWLVDAWNKNKKAPIERRLVTQYLNQKVKQNEVGYVYKHLVECEVIIEIKSGPSTTPGVEMTYATPRVIPNIKWILGA